MTEGCWLFEAINRFFLCEFVTWQKYGLTFVSLSIYLERMVEGCPYCFYDRTAWPDASKRLLLFRLQGIIISKACNAFWCAVKIEQRESSLDCAWFERVATVIAYWSLCLLNLGLHPTQNLQFVVRILLDLNHLRHIRKRQVLVPWLRIPCATFQLGSERTVSQFSRH